MIKELLCVLAACWLLTSVIDAAPVRPSIVWIVVEDASPNLSCYGETTIRTPNLDRMASTGVRFTNAVVTCPVCSPSRSAMVTGVYQTTLGAQNHRSQVASGKGSGNEGYYDSYRLPVKSVPRLFKDAGYFTCNSATGMVGSKFGKTDYNFIWNKDDYDGADWQDRKSGQPFFAQVQLRGGKNRRAKQHAADPASVELPPYYPDHPVLRQDWADYLNSWMQTDVEVGHILQRLADEGIADSTVVFFWTDHGVSHLRGKQFLYDEGIRVPLIVRMPDKQLRGRVRSDLITHIDVAATSLALAKVPIPDYVQGVDLFADNYSEREMVFVARDRCDETVEIIRCVRTKRFKYIRNFLPHLPHAQANQYKDGKAIVQTMRQLYAAGKLSDLQARPFRSSRPLEELYDLQSDPHETVNLADKPQHSKTLVRLRTALYDWMISSRDAGLIPEPILEELGRKYGNKMEVLRHADHDNLIRDLISLIDGGQRGDLAAVRASLKSAAPAQRYWAATLLGAYGKEADIRQLVPLTTDSSRGVRIAASLALCRLGGVEHAKVMALEVKNENLIVGMYALRGLELAGPESARPFLSTIKAARESPYEFTRRIAQRLTGRLTN